MCGVAVSTMFNAACVKGICMAFPGGSKGSSPSTGLYKLRQHKTDEEVS